MIIRKPGYGEHLWETSAMLCEIDRVPALEPTEAELSQCLVSAFEPISA